MSGLREIIASFGVDFDPKGLKQGDAGIQGMITSLKRLTTAAAGAFGFKIAGDFVFGLAEQAVELKHHSEALGISAQSLQMWDYAASLSGVSAEELQIGLQKLQRSAVGAGGKGGELGAVFEKLHVTVKNSNGSFKNADELLTDVAGAIGDMTDPTLQTATAMQIFGRGGARLLPFLKQGRAGVAGLKEEVAKLGGGFTDDFIEKSEAMVKDSKKLNFALTSLQVKALGPLIPLLTDMAEGATKWVVKAGDMIKSSQAGKTALVSFGVAALAAMSPLLPAIAAWTAGFLILEDVLTFLSGGKSLTGDLVNKIFGPDATFKVQAFVKALQEDFLPVLSDVWSILTSGEPLDARLKQLGDYVSGTLAPQFKTDFGDMADKMLQIVSAAGEVAKAINAIGAALKDVSAGWKMISDARKSGSLMGFNFAAQDAQNNLDAGAAAGGHVTTTDDLKSDWAKRPLWQRAIGHVLGADDFDKMAPQDLHKHLASVQNPDTSYLLASNVATAPVPGGGGSGPTELNQSIAAPITQNFYATTPTEVQRAASNGAKDGVKSGVNDRAMRHLVPTASGG